MVQQHHKPPPPLLRRSSDIINPPKRLRPWRECTMPVMAGPWVRHPAFKLSNRLQSQPSTTRFWSMNPSWWLLPRDCSDPSRGKAHRIGPIKSRRNSKCQTTSPIRLDHPHRRNCGWSVGDFAMSWPSKNDCMKKFPEPFYLHGRFFVVFCYIVLYLFRRGCVFVGIVVGTEP